MRDGPGWRAEVDLPPGIEATAVLEKRAALAAAMRRPISTVWPEADHTAPRAVWCYGWRSGTRRRPAGSCGR